MTAGSVLNGPRTDCQEPGTGPDVPSPSVNFKEGRYHQSLRAWQPEEILCQGCLKKGGV